MERTNIHLTNTPFKENNFLITIPSLITCAENSQTTFPLDTTLTLLYYKNKPGFPGLIKLSQNTFQKMLLAFQLHFAF